MGLREEKKELTRRALVDEATHRFLTVGYEETTLEQIGAAVKVSMRTLYRYFDSKERLFFAGQEEAVAEFARALRERPEEQSVLATWLAWIERFAAIAMESPLAVRHSEVRDSVPALRSHWLVILRRYEQLLTDGFVEELGPGRRVEARMVAGALVAGSDEVGADWLRNDMADDLVVGDRRVIELCDQLFGPIGVSLNRADV
jgi:AcrR family transcriptional regulator